MDTLIKNKLTQLFKDYVPSSDLDDLHDEMYDDLFESANDIKHTEQLSDQESVAKAFQQMGDLADVIAKTGTKKSSHSFVFEFVFDSKKQQKIIYEDDFSLEKIDQIDLSFKSDAVRIVSTSSEKLKVTQYAKTNLLNEPLVQVSRKNSRLMLLLPENHHITIGLFASDLQQPKLLIELPQRFTGQLNTRFSSGSLRLSDLQNKLSSEAHFTSGLLQIDKCFFSNFNSIFSSGSVKIKQSSFENSNTNFSSGSIRLKDVEGRYAIQGSSGSIHLDNVNGAGSAAIRSGSVHASFQKVTDDLNFSAASGSLKIHLPHEDQFSFKLASRSGSVKIRDNFNAEINFDIDSNSGKLGSVGDLTQYRVSAQTASGSAVID
ncbi:DUF4097 family beta strand repeat-containing protein [Oenococcus sicerae]|uniref:DUF4097 domain-containing protein n=1 Tax=Oenococcus sicerae TaxID=2203724 RepID=A0AAJ1RDY1_9LACO|nr:DUF4097 family beta strand repeat-containing protein [Oenococcus sicerae]MDN6900146.1 hypothetical protein [Oenococcus sicerae]